MDIGVVFPQTEIGADVAAIRTYAQRVEQLGYTHVMAYDHVLGADPAVHEGWSGPYDVHTTFHEPFVLFAYIAAITALELVTDIIILPQRQTALVAKQAAEVDLMTGGRFRLGVGLGWNAVEYEALDKDFTNRGKRMNEQIELLRRLWTEPTVTYEGQYERVTGAGLAPLPIQRPIPIWLGARVEPAYRRIGRLGDGWFPMIAPGPKLDEARAVIAEAAEAAGRDPSTLGMEGAVNWGDGNVQRLVDEIGNWRDAGATHVAVNTMRSDLGGVDGHIAALEAMAAALPLTPVSPAVVSAPTPLSVTTNIPGTSVEVIIEIPKGSRNKYEMDHHTGIIRLDRMLFTATQYPADYGFVPDTLAEDGDPLDVLVLLDESTFPGCHITARAVGVFWMRDEQGPDAKILCVPATDPRWASTVDIGDLQPHLLDEIGHFFDVYKDLEPGKQTETRGWQNAERARTEVEAARARYREAHGD